MKDKKINTSKRRKLVVKMVATGFLVTTIIATSGSFVLAKEVTVQYENQERVVSGKIFENVGNVLETNGIEIGDDYVLNVDADTFLVAVDEIAVTKKNTGRIKVDGEVIRYDTGAQTVGELLEEQGINLTELDRVEPAKGTVLSEVTQIEVIRVSISEVPSEVTIPYQTVEKENPELEKGQSNVLQKGVDGSKTVVERVLFENDIEVKRISNSESITKEAIDEIVEIGTKDAVILPVEGTMEAAAEEKIAETTPEKEGVTVPVETPAIVEKQVEQNQSGTNQIPEGSVKMVLNCTAYTATGNATASGVMPQANHTIAAWSGLPMGTKVYIPALGITYTVEDRGGAVTEGIIDIYMDTYEECIQFGRQNLEAYIIYQ